LPYAGKNTKKHDDDMAEFQENNGKKANEIIKIVSIPGSFSSTLSQILLNGIFNGLKENK
jgi:hypothetical protein